MFCLKNIFIYIKKIKLFKYIYLNITKWKMQIKQII